MHMPKTGGACLGLALHGHVHRMGHMSRLEDMSLWPPIITIVRDPVARWISGWDMCFRRRPGLAEYRRWPTADAAALDPEALQWLTGYWSQVFLPQSWWLRDAKYALSRLWYVAHTETLDADFLTIKDAIGATGEMPTNPRHRNASPTEPSTLSPEAGAAIREHYAADYRLLEGL